MVTLDILDLYEISGDWSQNFTEYLAKGCVVLFDLALYFLKCPQSHMFFSIQTWCDNHLQKQVNIKGRNVAGGSAPFPRNNVSGAPYN